MAQRACLGMNSCQKNQDFFECIPILCFENCFNFSDCGKPILERTTTQFAKGKDTTIARVSIYTLESTNKPIYLLTCCKGGS